MSAKYYGDLPGTLNGQRYQGARALTEHPRTTPGRQPCRCGGGGGPRDNRRSGERGRAPDLTVVVAPPATAITPESDSNPEAATNAVALPVFRPYAALLVVVAVLAGVLYWPVLRELVFEWWENPDYTHGFLVPVFAGFMVWVTRNRYKTIPLAPSNFGLLFMFAAIALLLLGTLAADEFSTRISICVMLAGM